MSSQNSAEGPTGNHLPDPAIEFQYLVKDLSEAAAAGEGWEMEADQVYGLFFGIMSLMEEITELRAATESKRKLWKPPR